MNTKPRKPRTKKPQRTATELLNDPAIATVSLVQASLILGVGRTTAHNSFKRTGFVADGVPAIRVGKRIVVSIAHLRNALGMSEPLQTISQ